MINGYKIINQNNEDVLFLYLDFNYEFASDFKDKKFLKNIKSFLKTINFKGTKVLIVSSGIIIGTLLINPIKLNKTIPNETPYNYVSKIIIHDFDNLENNLVNYEIIVNDNVKDNLIEKKENNKTTNSNSNEAKKDNKKNTTSQKISSSKVSTQVKQEVDSNKQMVTIYRNNGKILNIELEEYVIGVVAAEMPASFNIEALKAQAILARTYALKSIKNNKKLTDTVSTQAYKDNSQLKSLWGNEYDKYYSKIKSAVNATKGKVVIYNGEYIEAVYHSTSNGYTEDSKEVWGNEIPYLKTVESSWDKNVNSYKKTTDFTLNKFISLLNLDIDEPIIYEIIRNKSGRVQTIIINNKTFSGTKFRELLKLRSTDFTLDIKEDSIIITTYGYGHGVGMSQYGANEMAKKGYNYINIIKYYYNGVTIK